MSEINGCVVALADGGQIATAQHTAGGLTNSLAHGLRERTFVPVSIAEGQEPVYVNPDNVIAVQPANITQPTTEEPTT